jgi:hypothetical protein
MKLRYSHANTRQIASFSGMESMQSIQESATISSNALPSAVLPPVPLMTACGTQGQIAVTYVCINIEFWRRVKFPSRLT